MLFDAMCCSGKYVPSIAHYILQLDATAKGRKNDIKHPREIPEADIHQPNFKLGGIAIGNGFTGEAVLMYIRGLQLRSIKMYVQLFTTTIY